MNKDHLKKTSKADESKKPMSEKEKEMRNEFSLFQKSPKELKLDFLINKLTKEVEKSYNARTFLDKNSICYIQLESRSYNKSIFKINSLNFENFLKIQLNIKNKKILKSVVEHFTLEATKDQDGERIKVFHRVAINDYADEICIDLQDHKNFIRINEDSWEITDEVPYKFLTNNKMLKMPMPVRHEISDFINDFHSMFPFGKEGNLLAIAFLVKCLFRGYGEDPILVINGAQSSGKTVASSRLKSLINPTSPMNLMFPKLDRHFAAQANNTYLLLYDNSGDVSNDLADMFCVMSSGGGGIARSSMHSLVDETAISLDQPCIISGIDNPSTRPDFADRAIYISTKKMSDKRRISKISLQQQFQEFLPCLLGGLYEICSQCLNILPTIRTQNLPRLTDFARICLALERIPELGAEDLLESYKNNAKQKVSEQFNNNPLCTLILTVLKDSNNPKSELSGTALEIIDILQSNKKQTVSYPEMHYARTFIGFLRRHETLFNAQKIELEFSKRTSTGVKIKIKLMGDDDNDDNDDNSL